MQFLPYTPGIFTLLAGSRVEAGFPSPAADYVSKRIDVLDKIIKHPQATFVTQARGHSCVEFGIGDGDYLIVDKAIKARHGHIVIAAVDNDFTVKLLHQRAGGTLRLKAGNPTYPDIVPKDGQTVTIWAVALACIKVFKV